MYDYSLESTTGCTVCQCKLDFTTGKTYTDCNIGPWSTYPTGTKVCGDEIPANADFIQCHQQWEYASGITRTKHTELSVS